MERLIGEGISAKHLNDDVLGRTLNAIYAMSTETLYTQLSLATVKHLNFLCQTDGQYNSYDKPEEGVIQMTSRDHRPDLNPVV